MNLAQTPNVLRKIGITAIPIGAFGSVMLMLYAGRHQRSPLLILLFAGWVLSPFLGAAIASSISRRWTVITQMTLYTAVTILTFGCLVMYGSVAFGYINAKVGFVFLVVPLASWLLIAVTLGTSAFVASRHSRKAA